MSVLAPDVIASRILEQVTYQGSGGVSFDQLWELLPTENQVTPLYKSIVYSWIKDNNNLEVLLNGESIAMPANLDSVPKDATLRVAENYQWLVLTGFPKENNAIGNAAFQLLVEIAKYGPEGIDSLTLTKQTGQDSRSLTSRIKAISHLIQKLSVLKKGRTLSLFILNKFFNQDILNDFTISGESSSEVTINLHDIRERIINTLKNSKSGIRQLTDLRRELEMDKSRKLRVVFKSVVTFLEIKGYLAKLLVVSNVSPTKKIRSLKYLKDYVKNDSNIEDDDPDDDFFNTDLIDDDLKDLDDDDDEQPNSVINNNATNIEILEASTTSIQVPNFNRFFPLQNQLYQTVENHGLTGCSSNYLVEEFFGPEYSRLFTKTIESYTSGKLLPHLSDLGIIRHYDFNGRVKFYRYITRPNLLKLTHKDPDPNGFSLPVYKPKTNESIIQLNKKNLTTLGTKIDTYTDNQGHKRVLWRGEGTKIVVKDELNEDVSSNGSKKRSRSKKTDDKPKTSKKSKKSVNAEESIGDQIDPNVEIQHLQEIINQTQHQQQEEELQQVEPEVVVKHEIMPEQNLIISDLKITSFKAMEREAAILRLLDDSDGVCENNFNFYNDVREELGYVVDKRTFKRDIDTLVQEQKLLVDTVVVQDEEDIKGVSILISANASIEAIENFKRVIRETKIKKDRPALRKLEEINLEIDFFDTELRDSFNKIPTPKVIESKPAPTSKARKIKAKNPIKPKKEVKQKHTARIEPTETFDPSTTSVDELFENLRTKARPNFKKSKGSNDDGIEDDDETSRGRKRRNVHNLTNDQTLTLFKAVIICKTINENQINWIKIGQLLNINPSVLKTKWPRLRMMMGPTGIKVAKRNWKKILLRSVKDGQIELNEIENLNLQNLLELWEEYEERYRFSTEDSLSGSKSLLLDENKLFVNIEDNYKHYKFTKVNENQETNKNPYDLNSMIQREQYLINSVFTYDEFDKTDEENDEEIKNFEEIRDIIISIIASGTNSGITKLKVLEKFDEIDVNKVFLKLIKNRQIVIIHQNETSSKAQVNTKVAIGDKISSILEDNTFDFKLTNASKFQNVLKELLESNKGLVLNPLFDNSYMVPIIELVTNKALNLTRVDHYRKEVLTGYEARTLERDKLDSDIILTSLNNELIQSNSNKFKIPIPRGKACSHIWVDINGEINVELWSKILKVIVSILISKPGANNAGLHKCTSAVLSKKDLNALMGWLVDNKAVKRGDFDGYWLEPQWYMSLGF